MKHILVNHTLGPCQLLLHVHGQTVSYFTHLVLCFFNKQLKAGDRLNQAVFNHTPKKHLILAIYAFQQARSWSSNYSLNYKVLT